MNTIARFSFIGYKAKPAIHYVLPFRSGPNYILYIDIYASVVRKQTNSNNDCAGFDLNNGITVLILKLYNNWYNMPYSPIELLWVIGFAVSTVLGIVIISYRRYKEYSLKKQAERVYNDKEFVRHQMEIEKWKRKVFRP